MQTPILIVGGEAGSGKDTVAALIQKYTKNTICIAQADPMKRFAANVFGFTKNQLWGPSENRNAVDPYYDPKADGYSVDNQWDNAKYRLEAAGPNWIELLMPNAAPETLTAAMHALRRWFYDLKQEHKERGLTPRYALQTLGTEWGRQFSPLLWNDYTLRVAKLMLGGGYDYNATRGYYKAPHGVPDLVIVTDGRFANEIIACKMTGGISIKIWNPNATDDAKKVEAAGVAGHRSEAELKMIPDHFYDYIVVNDKTLGLAALEMKIANFVYHLTKTQTF